MAEPNHRFVREHHDQQRDALDFAAKVEAAFHKRAAGGGQVADIMANRCCGHTGIHAPGSEHLQVAQQARFDLTLG
ncbi:hypothetical protein [Agromyces aerolatus]|uniref:hypothetical protein n=1 Tax=Agromyces sp. LY-1074 TaxID=3074080 RepID=UPI00285D6D5B|nr:MULTISPECIES: hypothetical protein [unclassified Agromyces]MDR5701731.1 hypothetical protein [Agromyces sp. LY-1074]MDR5707990.1 hypothetical protein [Agromyces sp. LY-1358]